MAKKATYKNILSSIGKLKAQEHVEVFIPSTGLSASFSPLTVKQQKDILASGVDANVENLSFMNTMSDIVLDNNVSGTPCLAVDRSAIALQLRRQAIGNILTIEIDNEKYTVNIDEHISDLKKKSYSSPEPFTIYHESIQLECAPPDIHLDRRYNKQFTKRVQKGSKQTLKPTDVIGDVYVSDLVKWIRSITIGDETVVAEESATISNMVEIFENLPLQVSGKLADGVKEARASEIASLSNKSLPEGESISLSASLFTPSTE